MLTTKYNDIEILRFYNDLEEVKDRTDKPTETECKFARWIPKTKTNDDHHHIVLVHHYADGTRVKELKMVKDYKRPFWITRKIHQKYKDKKEFERIDRLQLHLSTQSELDPNVCKALEQQPTRYNLSNIKDSPYLYAYEIPSTSFIKYHYHLQNNGFISNYDVVNLDIEFDVTGKYNDVSIITLSMNGARHTAVLRRLYKDVYSTDEEIIQAIKEKSEKELPDSEAKRNCKIYNVSVHHNDLDLMVTVFGMLHKIKPDFVTIHNLVFDITKIMDRLAYYNFNPADLFSDPSIPKHLRLVTYKPAMQFKFKKGIKISIPIEEQWTTLDIMASFMIMDTMTGYAFIRQATGKLVGGYSLKNLLSSNDVESKLFYQDKNTEFLSGLKWHEYMSEKQPLVYTIYAEQDTVAMTNLENKTEDFTQSLPIFAGISDFLRYNSSTHRAICNGFLENRHKGLIVGTTPKNPVDRSYLTTKDWIKTLSSDHIQEEVGLEITNIPGLKTNVTANADDMDCVSSYPSDIQAANISSGTVRAEVLSIGDIPIRNFKDNNINIISSNSNSLTYCVNMLNAPGPIEMRNMARELHNRNKNTL